MGESAQALGWGWGLGTRASQRKPGRKWQSAGAAAEAGGPLVAGVPARFLAPNENTDAILVIKLLAGS